MICILKHCSSLYGHLAYSTLSLKFSVNKVRICTFMQHFALSFRPRTHCTGHPPQNYESPPGALCRQVMWSTSPFPFLSPPLPTPFPFFHCPLEVGSIIIAAIGSLGSALGPQWLREKHVCQTVFGEFQAKKSRL